jgi:hypothetical protein
MQKELYITFSFPLIFYVSWQALDQQFNTAISSAAISSINQAGLETVSLG